MHAQKGAVPEQKLQKQKKIENISAPSSVCGLMPVSNAHLVHTVVLSSNTKRRMKTSSG
jgi:hypothetical protein